MHLAGESTTIWAKQLVRFRDSQLVRNSLCRAGNRLSEESSAFALKPWTLLWETENVAISKTWFGGRTEIKTKELRKWTKSRIFWDSRDEKWFCGQLVSETESEVKLSLPFIEQERPSDLSVEQSRCRNLEGLRMRKDWIHFCTIDLCKW